MKRVICAKECEICSTIARALLGDGSCSLTCKQHERPYLFDEKDNAGRKNDEGKPPLALLSGIALIEIAKVLDFGQKKYATWNWKGGFKWSRVASAVLRHIFSWLSGEDKDPETGLSHLAHAGCGIIFLIDFEINKLGEDDRFGK